MVRFDLRGGPVRELGVQALVVEPRHPRAGRDFEVVSDRLSLPGFDFLGWRIQRRAQRGRTGKTAIYTYPSKKSMASIRDKVRTLTRRAKHRTLADLLRRLNPVLRGWCNYWKAPG